jgi:GR25 family glycosyltransferase involved in LPS biosynthesis
MGRKTICLNMIVKNESHVIERTLTNLCNNIMLDYWVIVDTGSTDNTKEVITNFFKEKNIPGEIHTTEWRDFAFNRTDALNKAYNKTDYLLIFDADDSIIGKLVLPELKADMYHLVFGQQFTYTRPLIVSNRIKSKYVGVLHEFFTFIDHTNVKAETITGEYYVDSGRTGARSSDPKKYLKDALVLEKAYEELERTGEDKGLQSRYAFYCAQSYKDYNMPEQAIIWYKKRIAMGGWFQETFNSYLKIGDLYKQMGRIEEAIYYYTLSWNVDMERKEGIYQVIRHYRETGNYNLAYQLYRMQNEFPTPDLKQKLFVTNSIYEYEMDMELTIIAAWIGKHKEALPIYKKLFSMCFMDTAVSRLLVSNFRYYCDYMSTTDMEFYQNFMNFVDAMYRIDKVIEKDLLEVIDKVTCMFKPLLTMYPERMIKKLPYKQHNKDTVLLTITTCKRFDLFEKTMNSFITCCEDINLITKFYCVDDNSSKTDRKLMKEKYPFFEFYFKSENEKGHRTSMNIIWNKLQQEKPTRWLHMEDDWLFIRKDCYIGRSIEMLNKYNDKGVRQVLFNKNYGETLNDYNLVGGELVEDNHYRIHTHNEVITWGMHCSYWPHYSFRPALVDTSVILELGNYDSPNTFFEMDYANRYTEKNYKSMFMNSIVCLHTGKLTTETNSTKQNAYALNGTDQFSQQSTIQKRKFSGKIQIINLKRREDRKENISKLLDSNNITNYQFFEAVDGNSLELNEDIARMFQGNDFGSRTATIGCALSHIKLWTQLVCSDDDYYLVMEDDITFSSHYDDKKETLDRVVQYIDNHKEVDMMFLGYHMFKHIQEDRHKQTDDMMITLEKDKYIGGFFSYIVTKQGAAKILQYITKNGVKHGIDYVVKIMPENTPFNMMNVQPHFILSDWVDTLESKVDSDIQKDFKTFDIDNYLNKMNEEWEYHPNMDSYGNDIRWVEGSVNNLKALANTMDHCVAFNSLGYMKSKVEYPLINPECFKNGGGLYVKKTRAKINQYKYVKMMCNWCSSEQLCEEWSNLMNDPKNKRHNNLQFVSNDTNVDYYVIINKPLDGSKFDKKRSIVFQMEPWVYDDNKNWGVKSWGEWAEPKEDEFLQVRSHKKYMNCCQWQLTTPLNELATKEFKKSSDAISAICSPKYFDEGHIKRVDFLKFLESKNNIELAIHCNENVHNFKNAQYIGKENSDKERCIAPYKYYFVCENNIEKNYITEKLWEPILCESLCFYWGAPNASDYIDSRAYVALDMNDFEASYQTIVNAIENNLWEERLSFIKQEKQKILNEYNFCNTLEQIIASHPL